MSWLRRNFDTCFIVLQVWLDGLTILLACGIGLRLTVPGPDLGLYRPLVVVIVAVVLLCFWSCGLYSWRKSILNVEEYRSLLQATFLAMLGTSTVLFLLRAGSSEPSYSFPFANFLQSLHHLVDIDAPIGRWSRLSFLLVFVLVFVLGVLQRSFAFSLASRLHRLGLGNTRLAVYGTGPLALRVEQKLRLFPTLGFQFVGFFDDDPALHGKTLRGYPVLGGRDELESMCRRHGIKRVIVARPEMPDDELVALCALFDDYGIDYQVVPRLYHFFSQRFTVDNLDSVPLISLSKRARQPFYMFLKAVFDRLVALILLILFFPFMLIVALLVKRESRGPVFFSQVRVGLKGRTFRMLKFRSMFLEQCVDDLTPESGHDPRVTRIGRFLRRTSLDELPQLINV